MTLLEQARRALPGVDWREHPDRASGWVGGRRLQVWPYDGNWYCRLEGDEHPTDSAEDALAVLRRWLVAERDALNAALGEGWVPVSERKPGHGEYVMIATQDHPRPFVAQYLGSGWAYLGDGWAPPTHWRPLPAQPEAK